MHKISMRMAAAAVCGIAAFSFLFTGCSKNSVNATTQAESTEAGESAASEAESGEMAGAVLGGWEINDSVFPILSDEERENFEKAASDLTGVSYEPLAVIGEQVVAGMNYAYFCQAKDVSEDAKPRWDVVVVYKNLEGNAEITTINDFDPADVKSIEVGEGEMLMGAWSCPLDEIDPMALPDEAYEAFTAATASNDGSLVFEPVALLSTQLVSGMNYRLLCKGTYYAAEPVVGVFVVDVYRSLDGNASITDYKQVDITAYV